MADNDTVILNPQATNEAINQFETVKAELGRIEVDLQSNSDKLRGVWKADASEEYYNKTKKLIENVNTVQDLLQRRITDIDTRTQKEKDANKAAKELSDSVNVIDLK